MRVTYLLILLALIVVGVWDPSSYAKIDPEAIMGVWLFDEGSGDFAGDSSGRGNGGELFGKPEWTDGKFGKALYFDEESDWVQIPDDPSLRAYDEVTVMAWINPERYFSPGTRWQGIIAKSNNPRSYNIYTDDSKQALIAFHFGGNHFVALSQDSPPLNEWSHLAFVTETNDSGGTVRCFINGNMTKETLIPELKGLPGDGDTNDVVIARTWEDNRFLLGAMDEVALFSVALADDEIKSIVANGLVRGIGIAAVEPSGKLIKAWGSIKERY